MRTPDKKYTLSPKSSTDRGVTFKQQTTARSQFRANDKRMVSQTLHKPRVRLNSLEATAICGNDITSSCVYVSAITASYAGAYTPIVLLLVAAVLYLYRKIYAEVGEALPLNGGAYNCLLNTTTKSKASVAACFTILSYIATAVISAKVSVEYLHAVFPSIEVIPVTIAVLAVFAMLTIIGIGESARVATCIFITHLTALVLLCLGGLYFIINNPEIITANFWQVPDGRMPWEALFMGFAVAMLGVSGFESSANFIEEQKPGVFPKTLRNMWLAVTILNPLIATVALGVLTMPSILGSSKEAMLVEVARNIGGNVPAMLLAIDAALVLSGAVLASFVGVTGLVTRMTLDRCLPQALLTVNVRGTNHRIILMFFFLCVSIIFITGGKTTILAGVYTISFLSVMAIFALGNILLKVRRGRLPRKIRASWIATFIALAMVAIGLAGNLYVEIQNLKYFLYYFVPTASIVLITLYRQHIMQFILFVVDEIMTSLELSHRRMRRRVQRWIERLRSTGLIFFTKGDDVASLNRAILYVQENEVAKRITVVHVLDGTAEPPPRLASDLRLLDEIYPDIEITLVVRKGKFGPGIIAELSEEFGIPTNYMFLGTPGDRFPHSLSDLGGVRFII
ncbi:MAG: APC family permease [Pseudomonadota bacterium]|nr:APC family permease [Pseudomonadota bacterium]